MEIVAKEGYWLTQKAIEDESQRGFWKRMYLAYSLTEEDFIEWADSQKQQWEEEHPMEEPEIDN